MFHRQFAFELIGGGVPNADDSFLAHGKDFGGVMRKGSSPDVRGDAPPGMAEEGTDRGPRAGITGCNPLAVNADDQVCSRRIERGFASSGRGRKQYWSRLTHPNIPET